MTVVTPNIFMETFTGRRPVVGDMHPEDVCLADITQSLCTMVRFLGHTSREYTVGEHSILVAKTLEHYGYPVEIVLAGLMHDAKEAYMGDWPTPIKRRLYKLDGFRELKYQLEMNIDEAICKKLGWITPEMIRDEAVVRADIGLLVAEASELVHSKGDGWTFSDVDPLIPPSEVLEAHGGMGGRNNRNVRLQFEELYNSLVDRL